MMLLLLQLSTNTFIAATSSISGIVREHNGGNCVGVKSCRPRCMAFHHHRDGLNAEDCPIRQELSIEIL